MRARRFKLRFSPYTFQHNAMSSTVNQTAHRFEHNIERRKRPRDDGSTRRPAKRGRFKSLDALRNNDNRRGSQARRLLKKSAFSLIAFHQMDCGRTQNRQDETWKTGAAANVIKRIIGLRQVAEKLAAIEKMAAPKIVQRCFTNKVNGVLPPAKERLIGVEASQGFT